MNSINLVEVGGEITREPWLVFDKYGKKVCMFIVTSRRGRSSICIRIRTTGRVAQLCSEVLARGDEVTVRGRLEQVKILYAKCKSDWEIYVLAKEVVREKMPAGEEG